MLNLDKKTFTMHKNMTPSHMIKMNPTENGENERSFGVDTRINKHKCNFPLLIVLYLKNI